MSFSNFPLATATVTTVFGLTLRAQDLFTLEGFNISRMNFGAPDEFKYSDLNFLAGSLA